MEKEELGISRRKKSNRFLIRCIIWGFVAGTLLGAFAAFLGSNRGGNEFVYFGLFGFLAGFPTGFILKAIDKLPPRKGVLLSREQHYEGGRRFPTVEEALGLPEDEGNGESK
jgi:hypothetical protein